MNPHSSVLPLRLALLLGLQLTLHSAASLVIDLSDVGSSGQYMPGLTSQTDSATVSAALGTPVGTLLYKINSDGSEDGSLQTSYNAAPGTWGSGTAFPIVIHYAGSGQIDAAPTYLLVKDGNLGSYVFNLGSPGLNWNGTDDILVYNLFSPKDAGGTSHIEFFGAAANAMTPVPEPTTLLAGALLALPLGIGLFRSFKTGRAARK